MRICVGLVLLVLWSGCQRSLGAAAVAPPRHDALLTVGTTLPVATVSERFLSVAVDTAQLVGGSFWTAGRTSGGGVARVPPYDFARPRLRALARPLGHAWLRLGGTDADRTYYALDTVPAAPPSGYQWMLTRAQLDGVADFARALDFTLLFTLDAGPGPRRDGAWQPDNARTLVEYVARHQVPVGVWELGNEVNAYPVMFGLTLDAAAYARDVARARALVRAWTPEAKLAAPASAYWPIIGELGGFLPAFLRVGGSEVDLVTWHFYPQESARCPLAVRMATLRNLLEPRHLDEIGRWADDVEAARRRWAPAAAAWLDETSNAQCGGAPGVSDTFASSLWWLDELGKMARRGTAVVVRQALSGADYGLLAEPSLQPRPDYFASVLWRRLMGARVLAVGAVGPRTLRAWAHCAAPDAAAPAGAVTLLLINVDERPVTVDVGGLGDDAALWAVDAAALDAPAARLDGVPLRVAADGTLPALAPRRVHGGRLTVAPTSYLFARFDGAGAAACR